jgi:hypothetical protein
MLFKLVALLLLLLSLSHFSKTLGSKTKTKRVKKSFLDLVFIRYQERLIEGKTSISKALAL